MLMNFWSDEGGALLSMEAVLLATIVVIGLVVGMSALRDGVVNELADVGDAISSVNQSFTTNGSSGHGNVSTIGSQYTDVVDFCDTDADDTTAERCIALNGASASEGT